MIIGSELFACPKTISLLQASSKLNWSMLFRQVSEGKGHYSRVSLTSVELAGIHFSLVDVVCLRACHRWRLELGAIKQTSHVFFRNIDFESSFLNNALSAKNTPEYYSLSIGLNNRYALSAVTLLASPH